MRPRALRSAAALAALSWLAGCATLEDRIVEPPEMVADSTVIGSLRDALDIPQRRTWLEDGLALAWLDVEPAARGFSAGFERSEDGARFDFRLSPDDRDAPAPPRGTLVFLHGWGLDATTMLPWALAAADHGWRGIVVDLRNHGASGRAPAGFGPREGHDVAMLLRMLRAEGGLMGPVHLMGISYGAVAGLHAAAELQDVDMRVIALSPYASAAGGIHGMVAGLGRLQADTLRGRLLSARARSYDRGRIDLAIDRAGQRLALDLRTIDVAAVAAASPACTLLLHGADDGFFPMEDVAAIAAASPHAELVPVPGEMHFTLPLRLDWLSAPLMAWLSAPVEDGACPPFMLPDAPGVVPSRPE